MHRWLDEGLPIAEFARRLGVARFGYDKTGYHNQKEPAVTVNQEVLRWAEMDEPARDRWARDVTASADEDALRRMILATSARRGALALPGDPGSLEASVNLSRSAALIRELERRTVS